MGVDGLDFSEASMALHEYINEIQVPSLAFLKSNGVAVVGLKSEF